MNKRSNKRRLPTRKEFVEFWEKAIADRGCYTLMFYAIWLGGGLLFALLAEPTWPLLVLRLAIALFVFTPIVAIWSCQKLHRKYIRCPGCGDSIGDDIYAIEHLTAWKGREPKWVTISKTGHCPVCGAQVIETEDERQDGTDIMDE